MTDADLRAEERFVAPRTFQTPIGPNWTSALNVCAHIIMWTGVIVGALMIAVGIIGLMGMFEVPTYQTGVPSTYSSVALGLISTISGIFTGFMGILIACLIGVVVDISRKMGKSSTS